MRLSSLIRAMEALYPGLFQQGVPPPDHIDDGDTLALAKRIDANEVDDADLQALAELSRQQGKPW